MPDTTDNLTIDPRLLQRLKGVELRSRSLVRGLYENRHRTKDFGASNEFVEHKSYQQGDEIRTIDWRAFARTKRLYVKRFEMEANMKVHLLLKGDVEDKPNQDRRVVFANWLTSPKNPFFATKRPALLVRIDEAQ